MDYQLFNNVFSVIGFFIFNQYVTIKNSDLCKFLLYGSNNKIKLLKVIKFTDNNDINCDDDNKFIRKILQN